MKFIQDNKLSVELFVSDRHNQVSKWTKNNMPNTRHKYDIWHVAKGILHTTDNAYFYQYILGFRKKVEKQLNRRIVRYWVNG